MGSSALKTTRPFRTTAVPVVPPPMSTTAALSRSRKVATQDGSSRIALTSSQAASRMFVDRRGSVPGGKDVAAWVISRPVRRLARKTMSRTRSTAPM